MISVVLKTKRSMYRSCRVRLLAICVTFCGIGLLCTSSSLADEFLQAVRTGDLSNVKRLASRKPELVRRDADGEPPLFWAVVDHHFEVAKWLLENGADANQRAGQDKRTPVFDAKTADMAKLLIEHGAEVEIEGAWSRTPLKEAVADQHIGVVEVLVKAGVSLDFDAAVELGKVELVKEMLAEKPWLAKPPGKPLYHAASDGNLDLVKVLLQYGADPDLDFGFVNIAGPYTPVSNAVTSNHYEVAKILLEHGASPNASGGRNHDNLFLYAIAYLDAEFTKLMLDHGADLVAGDSWGNKISPLHVAAALGGGYEAVRVGRVGQPASLQASKLQALEKVRLLVEAGANVNARASDGCTPLMQAAIAGHQDVCELLLENGAELEAGSACMLGKQNAVKQFVDKSPELLVKKDLPLLQPVLHWAVRANDVETVLMLIREGAKVDAKAPELEYQDASGFSANLFKDSPGQTALHVAIELGYERVVQALLDQGANPNIGMGDDSYLRTTIDLALDRKHFGIVRRLLEHDTKMTLGTSTEYLLADVADVNLFEKLLGAADVDLTQNVGTRLLARALAANNNAAANLLITRGAQIDLHTACVFGRIADARRLLKNDPALAKPAQADHTSGSPVELAVRAGHAEIVQLLIDYGATVSSLDRRGRSLAHVATYHGRLDVLKLLLNKGLSFDAKDESGSTLLHEAASGVQPQIARYLISKGADVNANDFGRSAPLHVLGGWTDGWDEDEVEEKRQRAAETAKILLDAGANVNAKDKYDATPLHDAATRDLEGVSALLLACGAKVNARNYRNKTPLAMLGRTLFGRSLDLQSSRTARLLRHHGGTN